MRCCDGGRGCPSSLRPTSCQSRSDLGAPLLHGPSYTNVFADGADEAAMLAVRAVVRLPAVGVLVVEVAACNHVLVVQASTTGRRRVGSQRREAASGALPIAVFNEGLIDDWTVRARGGVLVGRGRLGVGDWASEIGRRRRRWATTSRRGTRCAGRRGPARSGVRHRRRNPGPWDPLRSPECFRSTGQSPASRPTA